MNDDYEITPDEFELIEQYLADKLSPEELERLDQKKKLDINWTKKTEEVKLLLVGIHETGLAKSLDGFHDELQVENITSAKSAKVFKLDKRWMVAASLFLIASVATWLLVTSKTHNEKLYSRYFQPDPGLMTAMGSSDNYLFEKGMVSYKNGEYQHAIETWAPMLAKNPSSDTLQYFMGVAKQAIGDDKTAKQHLEIIARDSTNYFYHDACWYLGILYLKGSETARAKVYIERSSHPEKAALLKDINQN
jgi:hypothetical protein